jgi:hypothetical protein
VESVAQLATEMLGRYLPLLLSQAASKTSRVTSITTC